MLKGKLAGRYALECLMRTDGVVVFQPMLCDVANLLEIIKQISIQYIFSVRAVEALNVSVLGWLARLDVKQFYMFVFCPALESLRDQLWTVIHADAGRF